MGGTFFRGVGLCTNIDEFQYYTRISALKFIARTSEGSRFSSVGYFEKTIFFSSFFAFVWCYVFLKRGR